MWNGATTAPSPPLGHAQISVASGLRTPAIVGILVNRRFAQPPRVWYPVVFHAIGSRRYDADIDAGLGVPAFYLGWFGHRVALG